jgi:hypothetical protein
LQPEFSAPAGFELPEEVCITGLMSNILSKGKKQLTSSEVSCFISINFLKESK